VHLVHPVHRSAAEGHRVLISAPYGRDAESVSQLLTNHGYDAAICLSLHDFAAGIDDHAGVLLVTEEALAGDLAPLQRALAAQPAWSDIPFILLAGRRTGRVRTSEAVRRRLPDNATNVILLERPLSTESLLSTITAALRARQRQFQMRDQLAELDAQRTRLAEAAEGLEAEVAARTSDLKQALDDLRRESAERLRAEASLRQSQKMEAVGQLTGGVAHDFNNMLAGIIGAIDIMKRRMASNRYDDLERFMDAASVSAGRAAALTSRLLAFSRRQSLNSKPTDINGLVLSLSDLLRRTMSENISIAIETKPESPLATADANQLESAILNLAINARDAMPNGGRLTIETAVADLDEAHCKAHPGISPGRYVVIAVSDTGVGMTKELMEKVFDPFFTTKPIGQGTGLGLSMVYGFAQQSNGQVCIHSTPGEGTSVKIYLPAAEDQQPQVAELVEAPPQGAGQCVLLVEDDPSVRLLIGELLAELGYRTIEASDPQAAIKQLEGGRAFDLMISDVGLPGMNGRQLAEIARQHHPTVRILFVTGYAENAAIRAGYLDTNMAMIGKPFRLEELAAKIGEVLS